MQDGQTAVVAPAQGVLTASFFALFFYVWGTANLEGLFNYPFWRDMGAMMTNEDFVKLRGSHVWKVYVLLVAPFALLVLVTMALVFRPPPFVPRWVMLVVLSLELVGVVSTVFIQAPIQVQHNTEGYDIASFDQLIMTDFWLRKVPRFIEAPFVLFALWRAVNR